MGDPKRCRLATPAVPGFTLTVVDRVSFGLVAGLEGPRCRRCCFICSRFARTGTISWATRPSIPAELLRSIKVVRRLLDKLGVSLFAPAEPRRLWSGSRPSSVSYPPMTRVLSLDFPPWWPGVPRWTLALGAGASLRMALWTSMYTSDSSMISLVSKISFRRFRSEREKKEYVLSDKFLDNVLQGHHAQGAVILPRIFRHQSHVRLALLEKVHYV